jgi:hypothetical protein
MIAQNTRDASGVPAELREVLGLLKQLAARLPLPEDGNWGRYHEVDDRRDSTLRLILDSVCMQLAINDVYPEIAEMRLIDGCQRWAAMARKRLAEPLGYEPNASTAVAAAAREQGVRRGLLNIAIAAAVMAVAAVLGIVLMAVSR